MKTVHIGTRGIGPGEPCYVIAEAGSNHNGRLAQALSLIDLAASARVDAVKFQLFRASRMYPRSAGVSDYLATSTPIYDIIKAMEMPYEWLPALAERCDRAGVELLLSVFDEESADRVDPYVKAFKVASYEMTHLPLVRHICEKGKPVLVSTGTADLSEVAETVTVCREVGIYDPILMQCTAAYPAPLETLNVRALRTLEQAFDVPVGLSDHSRDPFVGPMTAVACGAAVVEKHFTLNNNLPGPDHCFAVEPKELRMMVDRIRETTSALGIESKVVAPVEEELRAFARRSVFALRDIVPGEEFTVVNVAVLRCGKNVPGLPPRRYVEVLGQRASRLVKAETAVQPADVA